MREDNLFKREIEKESLSDLGHVVIKNSDETVDMVDLWIVRKSNRKTNIKACLIDGSDDSFVYDVEGEFYVGPAKGMNLANIDTTEELTTVYVREINSDG